MSDLHDENRTDLRNAAKLTEKKAEKPVNEMTLEEIRTQIDRVDAAIKSLFIERMQLADQVAIVKAKTEDKIYKPDREAVIIEKQSKDMDASLMMEYRALIKRIMEVSRKYQYGRTLQLRSCFPYSFERTGPDIAQLGVIREELFLAVLMGGALSKSTAKDAPLSLETMTASLLQGNGAIHALRSYGEIADLISAGKLDGGMGVIEHIGSGVSDELNSMLLRNELYINYCCVVTDGDERKKVVAFTPRLCVLENHNRVKLEFVCPNRSGALGSIFCMIADYGVNVTEIHSIPFRNEDDWNYRFFVELEMNMLKEDAQALIFQLSQETMQMQLLGSYCCEGDFVE